MNGDDGSIWRLLIECPRGMSVGAGILGKLKVVLAKKGIKSARMPCLRSLTCAYESSQPIENDYKFPSLSGEIERSVFLFILLRSM